MTLTATVAVGMTPDSPSAAALLTVLFSVSNLYATKRIRLHPRPRNSSKPTTAGKNISGSSRSTSMASTTCASVWTG
jgi:hypothetical protein